MKQCVVLLCLCILLALNATGLRESSDIKKSGKDYTDDLDYSDINSGDIETKIDHWPARRSVNPKRGRQRIWKVIRREVRDMKNLLPTLASNISWIDLDVKDMNKNFFSLVGDIRVIKSEVMMIKKLAHTIWQNVTDTRRDHVQLNKTLWWILNNVTIVIDDVEKTVKYITDMSTSYGTVTKKLEDAVEGMSSEFGQIKTTLKADFDQINNDMKILSEIVVKMSHAVFEIRDNVSKLSPQKDHGVPANVSEISVGIANQSQLINTISHSVEDMTTDILQASRRIEEIGMLVNTLREHIDVVGEKMLTVNYNMSKVRDGVVMVDDKINAIGSNIADIYRQLGNLGLNISAFGVYFGDLSRSMDNMHDSYDHVDTQLTIVHERIISDVGSLKGDLNEMKVQLQDIRNVIAQKCESPCKFQDRSCGDNTYLPINNVVIGTDSGRDNSKPDFLPSPLVPSPPSQPIPPSTGPPISLYPIHSISVYPPNQPYPFYPPPGYPPSSPEPIRPTPGYPQNQPYPSYPPPRYPPSTPEPVRPTPGYPQNQPHPSYPAPGYPPAPPEPVRPTPGYPPNQPYPYYPPLGYPPSSPEPVRPTPGYPPNRPYPFYPPPGYPPSPPDPVRPTLGYQQNQPYPGYSTSEHSPTTLEYAPTTPEPLRPTPGYPPNQPHPFYPPLEYPPSSPQPVQPIPGYPQNQPYPLYPPSAYPPTTPEPLRPTPGYPPNQHYPLYPPPAYPPSPPESVRPTPGYPPTPPQATQPTPGYPSYLPSRPGHPPGSHVSFQPTPGSSLQPGHQISEFPSTTIYPHTTVYVPYPGYPPDGSSEYAHPQPTTIYPPAYPTTIVYTPPFSSTTFYPSFTGYPPMAEYPLPPSVPAGVPVSNNPLKPSTPRDSAVINTPRTSVERPNDSYNLGLPIGCGEEFSGICACSCPCDCTCPVIERDVLPSMDSILGRFSSPEQEKCECICSCPCSSKSASFATSATTPLPRFPIPDDPIENSCDTELIDDLIIEVNRLSQKVDVVTISMKIEHVKTRDEILDEVNQRVEDFSEEIRLMINDKMNLITDSENITNTLYDMKHALLGEIDRITWMVQLVGVDVVQSLYGMMSGDTEGNAYIDQQQPRPPLWPDGPPPSFVPPLRPQSPRIERPAQYHRPPMHMAGIRPGRFQGTPAWRPPRPRPDHSMQGSGWDNLESPSRPSPPSGLAIREDNPMTMQPEPYYSWTDQARRQQNGTSPTTTEINKVSAVALRSFPDNVSVNSSDPMKKSSKKKKKKQSNDCSMTDDQSKAESHSLQLHTSNEIDNSKNSISTQMDRGSERGESTAQSTSGALSVTMSNLTTAPVWWNKIIYSLFVIDSPLPWLPLPVSWLIEFCRDANKVKMLRVLDADVYDDEIIPNVFVKESEAEVAIPEDKLGIGEPMDPFAFHSMLQKHISNQWMKSSPRGSDRRRKGKRRPVSRGRGRTRNRYRTIPRPLFPAMPQFPFTPLPIGMAPLMPHVPNPLRMIPPRIPLIPPIRSIPNILAPLPHRNGSPYSASYNDGKGNSWNINVNRRSNHASASKSKEDVVEASVENNEHKGEELQMTEGDNRMEERQGTDEGHQDKQSREIESKHRNESNAQTEEVEIEARNEKTSTEEDETNESTVHE